MFRRSCVSAYVSSLTSELQLIAVLNSELCHHYNLLESLHTGYETAKDRENVFGCEKA